VQSTSANMQLINTCALSSVSARAISGAEDLEHGEERRSARAKVLLAAVIECDGVRIPVRVINLSANGVLVACDAPPPEDRRVKFQTGGRTAEGWTARVRFPHAGINFDEPIDPGQFLPKSLRTGDLIIRDTRDLDFRRPGFRGNQMTAEERQIVKEWNRNLREHAPEKSASAGRDEANQEPNPPA